MAKNDELPHVIMKWQSNELKETEYVILIKNKFWKIHKGI